MPNLRWWLSSLFGEGDPIPQAAAAPTTQVVIAPQNAVVPMMTTRAITDISARQEPEDEPKFERIYTVRLPRSCSMKIRMKTFFGRHAYGELTQANGNCVWFEPERIADRILDRELVPVIERYVREIFAMDRAFMANKPKEFIDEKGQRWIRA